MATKTSDYLLDEGKTFALYTLQHRAIPSLADGLKAGGRRVIWCARNGQKIKSATLAGIAVPLHPHAPPEDSIDTLTGPYVNNIPLFDGYGAFGTLMKPKAFGASRYTSVVVSKFTEEVLFRDIEIIPMKLNYDGTEEEPAHFLPLSPIVIMNPIEGIAVGYATNILPRTFKDIVESQLEFLAGKPVKERAPHFLPTNNPAIESRVDRRGTRRWVFRGSYEKVSTTEIKITRLPYGITHEEFINNLIALLELEPETKTKKGDKAFPTPYYGTVVNYVDGSRDKINIAVKFKRGALEKMPEQELLNLLNLEVLITENLNVVNLEATAVISSNYVDIIKTFTAWRFTWYVKRYLRLISLLDIDVQKYKDILLAIKKNVPGISKKTADRAELKTFIESIGVVHIDYIADLPVYRFTEEEATKVEKKLADALVLKDEYQSIVNDENKRKSIYISELKEVLKKFG